MKNAASYVVVFCSRALVVVRVHFCVYCSCLLSMLFFRVESSS